MTTERLYRVGFIGFGMIGKVHAYGYATLPYYYDPMPLRARITHVCTTRPETATKGAAITGAEHAVTDFRQITENPAIDIVHICTPNDQHLPALLSAMAHGKHIYCDKPLVCNLAEAAQVTAALTSYRGTSQMTLQNRFFPAIMRARQLLAEGFLGQLLEVRADYLHSGSADPRAPLKWKLSAAAGGGVIADLAVHILDLVHALCGDYRELLACTEVAYRQRPSVADPTKLVTVDAEDSVMILARPSQGGIANISASKITTGSEDEVRVSLHGSQGALRFNAMTPHWLELYDARQGDQPLGGRRGWTQIDVGQRFPKPAASFPTPKASLGWIRAHVACLHHFLSAVAAGQPGDLGLAHGVYLQQLLEACRLSALEQRWQHLPPR